MSRVTRCESTIDTCQTEDQYQKLRYVNYPSNVQVLCYAVDSSESWAKLDYYHRELQAADPCALTVLCALRIETRDDETLKQRGITPISTEQGQARARELNIAHYFEISARKRQGLKEFFEFFQQIADPTGIKRIDSKGELWTVLDKMPPVPPAPVVRVDASNICTELRQSLNSPLVADVVFTIKGTSVITIYSNRYAAPHCHESLNTRSSHWS